MNLGERLGPARDVNTPWSLRHYTALGEWERRAAEILRTIIVQSLIHPIPCLGTGRCRCQWSRNR